MFAFGKVQSYNLVDESTSTATTSGEIRMIIGANLPEEMLCDARWHVENAKSWSLGDDPLVLWREVRSAILFSMIAVEAQMNMAADEYLETCSDPIVRDFLEEKQSYVKRGRVVRRHQGVALETKLTEWTQVITGNSFDKSDSTWEDFMEVKDWRNALVHYRPSNHKVYDQADSDMAQRALDSAKAIIARFYDCSARSQPPWLS